MKPLTAYIKKELIESIYNFRLIITLSIFFLVGVISPLGARFLPEILNQFLDAGIEFYLPEPTYLDAYHQLFENITQLAMIAFVLVFGNTLSGELSKNSLQILLSKGLSRWAVVLSKYVVMVVIWTLSLALSTISCYLYTYYFFGSHRPENLFEGMLALWVFGAFIIGILIWINVLIKSYSICLLLFAICIGVLYLLNLLELLTIYNPVTLLGVFRNLSLQEAIFSDYTILLSITSGFSMLFLLLATYLIYRKSI